MASNKLHQNDQQQNSEWRYGLDDKASHTITLRDGRKLGYTDHGSPTGDAILYQHGLPGSRLEAESYHELAVELGARVIGIDRPGMGLSSPCPSRTVRDWAQDVEYLTEQLGLKTYSVLGVSGGGPYALSCAFGLPAKKLKCVSIVCGLGSPDMSMWNADWMHWLGFPYGWRYAPVWMLNAFFRLDEFGRMDLSDDERLRRVLDPKWLAKIKYPKDKVIYGDESVMRLSLRATREANRQGFEGIARDGKTACSDWGFKIENIRKDLPVKLWYGKDDRFIPANHGMEIAKRLGGEGGKVVLRLEDDSHFSISRNWRREQFEEILKEMRG